MHREGEGGAFHRESPMVVIMVLTYGTKRTCRSKTAERFLISCKEGRETIISEEILEQYSIWT